MSLRIFAICAVLCALVFTPTVSAQCHTCTLDHCVGLNISTPIDMECSVLAQASLLVTLSDDVACGEFVAQATCSLFATWGAFNFNNSCSEETRAESRICVSDCEELNECTFDQDCTDVTQFATEAEGCMEFEQEYFTMLDVTVDNTDSDVTQVGTWHQMDCLTTAAGGDGLPEGVTWTMIELGPLAGVITDADSFPEFYNDDGSAKLVKVFQPDVPLSLIFKEECIDVHATILDFPERQYNGIAIAVVAVLAFVLYAVSVRAADKKLDLVQVGITTLCLIATGLIMELSMAYQLNLSCFALFYPFFVTAPMVSFVATSRSTALAGALGHEKSKALTEKYLKGVTILSILGGIFVFLSALAVLVAAVLVSGGWFSGVIDSMRCEWWDINDEILDLASAAGIAVSPDPVIHPNTYVPYSPSISTCQYCQPGAAGVVLLVLFSILPTILVSVMCIFRLAKASAGARKWHKVELLITNVLCLISALWFFALGMLDTNSGTVIFTVFVWLHIVNSLIVPAVLNLTVRKEHAKTIDVVELPL